MLFIMSFISRINLVIKLGIYLELRFLSMFSSIRSHIYNNKILIKIGTSKRNNSKDFINLLSTVKWILTPKNK